MDTKSKKQLHHAWTKFRAVKVTYLVIALLVSLLLTVVALRHNNQTMVELRQAVYQADEQNSDVEGALRKLREYVHAHMNTDLSTGSNSVYPPLQLQHTYERLVAAEQERIKAENGNIYTAAQEHCERLHPESYSGGPRVPCIRDYVSENGIEAKKIPDSLYKFDFVSPRWSPDLAGWSLVGSIIIAALLVVRLSAPRLLKALRIT